MVKIFNCVFISLRFYCLHFKATKAMMFYTSTWGILFSIFLRKVIFQKLGILNFQLQAVRQLFTRTNNNY